MEKLRNLGDRQKALLAILVGSILGGATNSVTKVGLEEIPPLTFAFLRFLLAFIIILPFIIKQRKIRSLIGPLTPLSTLASINIVMFILGITLTTATIGQLLYSAVPLMVAIICYFFFKEIFTFKKVAGLVFGFIGVAVVILLPVLEEGNMHSGNIIGNLLISTGVICWAFYMAYSKNAQKSFSPFVLVSNFIFTTVVLLFPLFLFEMSYTYDWWKLITIKGIFSFLYITVISTIFTYFLNQYAIKHGGAVLASIAFYLLPFFAFLSANILLKEQLTPGLIGGGFLTLLGVYLVTKK